MPLLSPSDTAFAEHWQALDSAEVLRRCGTDPAVGLSADLAAQRLVERGANALPEPPPRPLWRTFLRQFKSALIYILLLRRCWPWGWATSVMRGSSWRWCWSMR